MPKNKENNPLKKLRHSRQMSQQQVADKLGISRSAWSFLENKKRALTVSFLNKIQTTFRLDASEVEEIRSWWGTHNPARAA